MPTYIYTTGRSAETIRVRGFIGLRDFCPSELGKKGFIKKMCSYIRILDTACDKTASQLPVWGLLPCNAVSQIYWGARKSTSVYHLYKCCLNWPDNGFRQPWISLRAVSSPKFFRSHNRDHLKITCDILDYMVDMFEWSSNFCPSPTHMINNLTLKHEDGVFKSLQGKQCPDPEQKTSKLDQHQPSS